MFLTAVCALTRLLEQATGFRWESVWIRGPRLSRTPRRSHRARPVRRAEGSSPRQPSHRVSCHVVAESGIRQSFVGRTNFPCCRYIDSGPGGSGDFVQRSQGARSPRRARSKRRRIQRFRLVRWSTLFWGAEEFGFMAPRTEDQEQPIAPPERHVSAKGSHCRQRSRSAAKESVLSALIQKQCRSRPSRRRDWVSREPTSEGVLFQA